ncbi:MAG: DUF4145 domain-containing protein [Steroidobacteraceae bacterium]
MEKRTTSVGKPGAELIKASCEACGVETRHKILTSTLHHWADDENGVSGDTSHEIIECQGCGTVSFREASSCSEDYDFDERTGEASLNETVKLYPNRISGRAVMREVDLLPHNVYSIYQEAHACLCAGLGLLAGLGLRVLVEAVCKDKQIFKGNLQDKIESLAVTGHTTPAGAKILHSLRSMGNDAAHETKAHTPKQLNAAFNVVEHLLHGVYVLPAHAAALPQGNQAVRTEPKGASEVDLS